MGKQASCRGGGAELRPFKTDAVDILALLGPHTAHVAEALTKKLVSPTKRPLPDPKNPDPKKQKTA